MNKNNHIDNLWGPLDAVCFSEEVNSFADKEDSMVGEWGITLSGGQRQRLSLARILNKKYPIYILDDALSNVDIETELRIYQNIKQQIKNSICIITSHRLTNLHLFDLIIFLKDGQILDIGTHDQLRERTRDYSNLITNQNIDNFLKTGTNLL